MNFDPNLIVTIIIQLVTIGYVAGIARTRINHLETQLSDVKVELRDYRIIREDIAVIKSQLSDMHQCLRRLSANQDKLQEKIKEDL